MVINKKIISFDFDDTLALDWVQENLFHPLSEQFDVIIITSRCKENENEKLWDVSEKLGIKKDKVFFTDGKYKSDIVDKLKSTIHFDDNFIEVHQINSRCKCKALLLNYNIE
jgi:hypothetical protein